MNKLLLNQRLLQGIADLMTKDFIDLTRRYGFNEAIEIMKVVLPKEVIKNLKKNKAEFFERNTLFE